ncbi:hypothetical protein E1258_01000 [Micromonospora sp. KC207]|uniref:hypothetical protein n=1 Tax=Micromonospora sp. KC207 TaxID=2530377 RepID=UPI001047FD2B|nr:hypothetical protein [Micromonospora sp. KC207]TDC67109.1 hypothetical protein E1258_01000 [Micromonospora sp. KC207]
MAPLRNWNVLAPGEGPAPEVVLAVDFFATGRPEAGFTDLAPRLTSGHAIWETVPPPVGTEADMSGTDYARWWLADVEEHRPVVRACFGYCAGSNYAVTLAERIAQWQERPRVVLFDPEAVTPLGMYGQFHKVIGNMSTVLSAEEIATAQKLGWEAQRRQSDLRLLGQELKGVFRSEAGPAFDRLGIDDTRKDEFAATFGSFLAFLAAAVQIEPAPVWTAATAISSASPNNGLNLVAEADRAGLVADEVRFDLVHADLLRDTGVAKAVDELLR